LYPDDLKYTTEHEWVRVPGEHEGSVRIGITHFAQEALGDIVYVSLPEVGDTVEAGTTCGELESTKSVSDVYAPVSGEVVARNEALDATPGAGSSRSCPRTLPSSTACSTRPPTRRRSSPDVRLNPPAGLIGSSQPSTSTRP
jgi:glycine cleavage system H protein